MDLQEKARVLALAKLSGIDKTDSEILETYSQYFQEALKKLQNNTEPAKVEVFKRPF